MAIYSNKALRDQQLKVAMQQRQREIARKARGKALGSVVGAVGTSLGQTYAINAKEVAAKAKELGLNSPEEIAGLEKVMEFSKKTGLSVEEIANSEGLMTKLHQEAAAIGKTKARLDESMGELNRDIKQGDQLNKFLAAQSEVYADAAGAAIDKRSSLEGLRDTPLRLPLLEADKEASARTDDYGDAVNTRVRSHNESVRLKRDLAGKQEELAENAAKLKALESMGVNEDELAALRKSAAMGIKLDKLASRNLMGRDYIGRQASTGAREGNKLAAEAALAKMKADLAKQKGDTAKVTAETAGVNAITAAQRLANEMKQAKDTKTKDAYAKLISNVKAARSKSVEAWDERGAKEAFVRMAEDLELSKQAGIDAYHAAKGVVEDKIAFREAQRINKEKQNQRSDKKDKAKKEADLVPGENTKLRAAKNMLLAYARKLKITSTVLHKLASSKPMATVDWLMSKPSRAPESLPPEEVAHIKALTAWMQDPKALKNKPLPELQKGGSAGTSTSTSTAPVRLPATNIGPPPADKKRE